MESQRKTRYLKDNRFTFILLLMIFFVILFSNSQVSLAKKNVINSDFELNQDIYGVIHVKYDE
ncbi:MAG: flagellar motor protein MotB, partial [Candidatus Heimdallarchaeaceae archaeon]